MNSPDLYNTPIEDRAHFTPEQKELWLQQDRQHNEDFCFMVECCDQLYFPLRKHFKRTRAALLGNFSQGCDDPLYEAFDQLIALHRALVDNPDFLPRFEQRMKSLQESHACTIARLKSDKSRQVSPVTSPVTEAASVPSEGICPDCGSTLDINSTRCPVCRRFVE